MFWIGHLFVGCKISMAAIFPTPFIIFPVPLFVDIWRNAEHLLLIWMMLVVCMLYAVVSLSWPKTLCKKVWLLRVSLFVIWRRWMKVHDLLCRVCARLSLILLRHICCCSTESTFTDSVEPVWLVIVFSLSSVEVDRVGDTLVDLPMRSLLSNPVNLVTGDERITPMEGEVVLTGQAMATTIMKKPKICLYLTPLGIALLLQSLFQHVLSLRRSPEYWSLKAKTGLCPRMLGRLRAMVWRLYRGKCCLLRWPYMPRNYQTE